MSSVRKRINSTGRRRIPQDQIDIRMIAAAAGEPLKARATLQLEGMNFPATAGVSIDAYHRSTGMRFECGTVGQLRVPPLLELNEIDRSVDVLFRVKVFDRDATPGKLLGAAERISPQEADNPDGKRKLFPVKERDLGAEVWRVECEDEQRPTLILNNRIPGLSHRILQNPLAQGLLLPEAMRIVLQYLVADPVGAEEGEDDWKGEWVRFTRETLGLPEDLDALSDMTEEARAEWVKEAIRAFCELRGFVEKIKAMTEGEAANV